MSRKKSNTKIFRSYSTTSKLRKKYLDIMARICYYKVERSFVTKWTKEEIKRLKDLYPVLGMKCAPLFGRSEKAVGVQASKYGIAKTKHTKESLQNTLPKGFKIVDYINTSAPMRVLHEVCGTTYYVNKPTGHLGGRPFKRCPTCYFAEEEAEYIEKDLPEDIELISPFKGVMHKILHRHKLCGTEWLVKPHDIQNGTGCPVCVGKGPTKVYLLYFPELNLHKIGISNNPERRSKQFGYKADIVWVEEYGDYSSAKVREEEVLSKVTRVNTGLLRSGNTETFVE